jgi:hypothetical protein
MYAVGGILQEHSTIDPARPLLSEQATFPTHVFMGGDGAHLSDPASVASQAAKSAAFAPGPVSLTSCGKCADDRQYRAAHLD